MARTSCATSHTRPSTLSRSTTVERNSGTRHGSMRPKPGNGVHRSAPTEIPHLWTRSARVATASSPMLWASGARERERPSSYSAHQRTTTEFSSQRSVPTTATCGVASASKLPSEELMTKRRRSAVSHVPRNSATSAAGTTSGRSSGNPSNAFKPSMRAARIPPSSNSNPVSRSIRGCATT